MRAIERSSCEMPAAEMLATPSFYDSKSVLQENRKIKKRMTCKYRSDIKGSMIWWEEYWMFTTWFSSCESLNMAFFHCLPGFSYRNLWKKPVPSGTNEILHLSHLLLRKRPLIRHFCQSIVHIQFASLSKHTFCVCCGASACGCSTHKNTIYFLIIARSFALV